MMFGREPSMPLTVSSGTKYHLATDPSDVEDYMKMQALTLQKIYREVRHRQDRASHYDADRRDVNRKEVLFETNDPVLYFDPQSVAGYSDDDIRPEIPATDQRKDIPQKWKLPWTGPHRIEGKKSDNVYLIYHTHRKKVISANVDSLTLYHPFENLTIEIQEEEVEPAQKKRRAEPDTQLYTQSDIKELKAGDMCIVHHPKIGFEPLAVMKFIQEIDDGLMELQWYGSFRLIWYFDLRLRSQKWRPGYWQQSTKEFYFSTKKLHVSHPPFTNLHSEDIVRKEQIVFFNFKLNKADKLPQEIAEKTLEKFRTLEDGLADGNRTTESPPDAQ